MDFLQKGYAWARDLYGSLTPGTRFLAILLLVASAGSLGWLFYLPLHSPDGYLLGGRPFTASELPAIQAAFDKAGLTGAVVEGNRIRVPKGQENAYVGAMAADGALPADFGTIFEKTLAEQPAWGPPETRREALKNAKQRELAAIIRAMPNIESAAVHYDVRKPGGLSRDPTATASVSVKPALGHTLDAQKVRMIRHLVASAIAGLKPENVTVADLNGMAYPGTGDQDSTGEGADHKYLAVMRAHRDSITSEVLKALSYVSGVTVAVNVELDPEIEGTRQNLGYDPKKSTAVSETEKTSRETSSSEAPGGRPGLAAQQGTANQSAELGSAKGRSTSSETEETTRQTTTAPGHEVLRSRHIGLIPKRVTVAVGVPTSHYENIWKMRHTPADGTAPPPQDPAAKQTELQQIEQDEILKIKKHVARLIPTAADLTTLDTFVQVTSFAHVPQPAPVGPPLTDRALTWFGQHWSTLGLAGLTLFSLVMLRSMVKSIPAAAPSLAAADAAAEEPPEEKAAPAEPNRTFQRQSSGLSLRDELTQLVKDDPNAAATIIKSWIGSAN
jgi:flagellar M-ring protein FliF